MHTSHFQPEDKYFYRIEYDIESKYLSLGHALANLPESYKPMLPTRYLPEEEATTPRISVCPSVLDCFSAITYNTFAKCSWSRGDEAAQYNDGEAYPIIIVTFKNPSYVLLSCQITDKVPDASLTHECWILSEEKPVKQELVWLDRNSLSWMFHEDQELRPWGQFEECVEMIPCKNPKVHPWLTPNQGSTLMSQFPPNEFWRLVPEWGICQNYGTGLCNTEDIPIGELFHQMYDELCQGIFIPKEESW